MGKKLRKVERGLKWKTIIIIIIIITVISLNGCVNGCVNVIRRLLKANTCPVNDTQLESSCVDCLQTGLHRRSGKTSFSKVRLNVTTLEVISKLPSSGLICYYTTLL